MTRHVGGRRPVVVVERRRAPGPYSGTMRVVVMGVAGCGKSSVGERLASALGYDFADADAFHSEASIAKMSAGVGLSDEDRWPWLDTVGDWLHEHPDSVMACSALRRSYRDRLKSRAGSVVFLHLMASRSVLERRLVDRSATSGHFASVSLLASQLATLEPLGFDEVGGVVDVSHASLEDVIHECHDIIALHDD